MDRTEIESFTHARLLKLIEIKNPTGLEEDLLIIGDNHADSNLLKYPCRINSLVALVCQKGEMVVNINLNEYHIQPGTMILNIPQNIVQLKEQKECKFYGISISTSFFEKTNFNTCDLIPVYTQIRNEPCLQLTEEENDIFCKFISLIQLIGHSSESPNKKTTIRELSTALINQLYDTILKRKPIKLLKDTEFRWYVGSYAVFTAFVTIALLIDTPMKLEESFRLASFQVASLQTTTGFGTADYMLWPSCTWLVLCFAMIVGACAGSTTGAIKCIRLAMLFKIVRNQFRHMLHPNAVLPLRISGVVISGEIKSTLLAFFFTYISILLLGWLFMLTQGVGFMEGFGITVSSLGNVGPGLGNCGPAYSWNHLPDAAKWACSFLMLIGRLELFSVLLLFSPGFWKKH